MREIACAHLLSAPDRPAVRDRAIRIDGAHIESVAPAADAREQLFALPALANAHDHARTARSSSFGTAGKPLETWLHYLALLPAVDPYLATAVSLARSALGGAGSVMVHYTRVQGLTDLPDRSRRGRPRGARCRRAHRLRGRAAQPQSAGLWAVGADPRSAPVRGARGDHAPLRARTDAGARTHRADRCHRGECERHLRPAIRSRRRAMVHARTARSRRRGLRAHRPAHPHASARDALSAPMGGREFPRRHREISRTRSAFSPSASRSRIAPGRDRTNWSCSPNAASRSRSTPRPTCICAPASRHCPR